MTEILGQDRALKRLEAMLRAERVPSALVFTGQDGVGKALAARALARGLVCGEKPLAPGGCGACGDCKAVGERRHPDVKSVDAAYQAALREEEVGKQRTIRVDTVRHLRRDMSLESLLGGWKVAVIEEAHTLEPEAANALLKILEEPPARTLWILVTSQPDRLPKTVLSRCQRVPFSPLPDADVSRILESLGVPAADAARLGPLCEGSVSRALALSQSPGYPESLLDGPLAPFSAADALPKELYLARPQAELALFALGQRLRLSHLRGGRPFSSIEKALRELASLRRALRSNADPRAVLALAALEAERL